MVCGVWGVGWGVWCLVSGVKEWCFAHDGRQACKTSGSRPTRQLCPETVAGERRDGSMALGNFLEDRPAEQRKLGIAAGVSLERCREAVPGGPAPGPCARPWSLRPTCGDGFPVWWA